MEGLKGVKLKGRARQDTAGGAVKIVQGASIDSKRFLVKLPDEAIVPKRLDFSVPISRILTS